MGNAKVSVVLGTYNRLRFLKAAIESIRNSDLSDAYEIIVIDGGSTDGTIKWLTNQQDILSIVHHNRVMKDGVKVRLKSWGYFMNLGFKAASSKYICMISDDSVLQPNALREGVKYFDDLLDEGKKVGAVPFYWRSWPEEQLYRVGRTFSDKFFVNHGLFLTQAIESIGWFDSETYSFYCSDGDAGLRLHQAGYEIFPCEKSLIEHYDYSNVQLRKSNNKGYHSDWEAYTKRWAGIYYDPATEYAGTWDKKEFEPIMNPRKLFPLTWVENLLNKIKFKNKYK